MVLFYMRVDSIDERVKQLDQHRASLHGPPAQRAPRGLRVFPDHAVLLDPRARMEQLVLPGLLVRQVLEGLKASLGLRATWAQH